MPAPYSDDLRERVVGAYLSGLGTYGEVGDRFSVGEATVNRWVNRFRRTRSVSPDPMGGDRHSKLDEAGRDLVRQLVEEQPDITRQELVAELATHDLPVSTSCVQRALEALELTRKKRRSMLPSATPKR